jgi:hypothetical protein
MCVPDPADPHSRSPLPALPPMRFDHMPIGIPAILVLLGDDSRHGMPVALQALSSPGTYGARIPDLTAQPDLKLCIHPGAP